MTYRSDRRGETPEKPWPLEAVYPVGTPRANFIMARNSNVPFERPKIRMQSICHSTRKSNIRMLKRIFGKRIWDSCAYLTGGVQIRLPWCRVESGRADRPFHRPLNQTARAVFPQAAFLSCSSFGIRGVAAGGGFVRTAFGSFAKGTIQFHDISAFPIARTFTTEYGDFPLQRAFWTRQRRCSKQRSETLCLPSRS